MNSGAKYMANDDFSEPPRRADFNNPIFVFFFADFWVWVTSEAGASVSLGFWGSRQLSPLWGGSSQGALLTPPPPPQLKARPSKRQLLHPAILDAEAHRTPFCSPPPPPIPCELCPGQTNLVPETPTQFPGGVQDFTSFTTQLSTQVLISINLSEVWNSSPFLHGSVMLVIRNCRAWDHALCCTTIWELAAKIFSQHFTIGANFPHSIAKSRAPKSAPLPNTLLKRPRKSPNNCPNLLEMFTVNSGIGLLVSVTLCTFRCRSQT